jgi:hypothetical protein
MKLRKRGGVMVGMEEVRGIKSSSIIIYDDNQILDDRY